MKQLPTRTEVISNNSSYEFVCKTFHLALPHPSQIKRWYSQIPVEGGFTKPALEVLKSKVDEAERDGKKVSAP